MNTENQADVSAVGAELLEPKNWWKIYLIGWAPLALSYLIILGIFVNITGRTLITTWTANVLFPSVAGLGVIWFVLNVVLHQPIRVQIGTHIASAVAFSTLWAITTFRLLQVFSGLFTGRWAPPDWPSPVVAWQLFQGLAVYFTIVSATYAYWALSRWYLTRDASPAEEPKPRIYAKTDDGWVPLAVEDICAARSIDGITYIVLGRNELECRMNLTELEAALPSNMFLRVHRSAIVNLDRIQSIEPAGNGRQSIHLKNGITMHTSRAGTTALRDRIALI